MRTKALCSSIKQTAFIIIAALGFTACNKYVSYTDTIEVNGQKLFYAVEGQGKPVVLIHGNGGSHNDLETTMRQLAQNGYTVYALDSRGQGANAPLEEYHYIDMAEDTYQFINALHIDKPAIFGWSDGGNIALQLEVLHPGTCSLIVTSGANITAKGALKEDVFEQIFSTTDSVRPPLIQMMFDEPNMAVTDMQSIGCPALICAGENDLILESHTRLIAKSIPHGQVHIEKGADHGSHIWHNTRIGEIILDFFKVNKY